MKCKLIIICGIVVGLTLNVQGQVIRGTGIKVGVISATQIWNNPDINSQIDPRWGFDAGCFLDGPHYGYISVMTEMHYSQKGYSVTQTETLGKTSTFKPRIDYLSVPVFIKIRGPGGIISPYIFGGPRFDFQLSHKPNGAQTKYDNMKNTDIGSSVGFGFEIETSFHFNYLAEFRYCPSFTNIYENESVSVKNRSLEFFLGILWK